MSAITIRKLPEGLKQRLRMRAAANGRSMEAEARDILVSALAEPRQVDLTWVEMLMGAAETYGGPDGVELDIAPREVAEPPDFSRSSGDTP
ncbi:plasmid stabilization protein [Nocardioides hungaricus]